MRATGGGGAADRVDYASHSAQMEPMLDEFGCGRAGRCAPGSGAGAFRSTVDRRCWTRPVLDGDYWCRNLRQHGPVRTTR